MRPTKNSISKHLNRLRLLPVFLLIALPSLHADNAIVVTASGTNVVIQGTPTAGDIVSSGIGAIPAVGNSVELQNAGDLAGNIIGDIDIPGSGFERLKMNGTLWSFTGTADLMGTSATTLHIATGTFSLGGAVLTGSVGAGANAVTVDSGATLHFATSGTINKTGIINNGRIYVARTGNTYIDQNISGSGLIETENVVYLTGTNTHTGGILISTGDLYANSPAALGSGTINIRVATCDLFLSTTASGDFTFNNALAGQGRMIVKLLAGGTDVFHFGSGVGSDFAGTFIAQVGTYKFDANADAALANASLISIDRDSTVLIASGSHHYKKIQLSSNAAAEVSVHRPAVVSFEGDFSGASAPITSRVYLDDHMAVATTANITLHTSGPVAQPTFAITTATSSNLLGKDEETGPRTAWTGTLLSLALNKKIDNPGNFIFKALDNTELAGAAQKVPYTEGANTVGNLIYNYYTTADVDGIYLKYGLTALEVVHGKTLTLTGDVASGGRNDWKLRLTGSGNLNIAATTSILLSNNLSDLTGMTTVTSGMLIVSGSLGTGSVTVNPGTTLQIGNGVVLGYAGNNIINNGTLKFSNATHTVSSNISGTSKLRLDTGTIILGGTNTFTGGLEIASNNHEIRSTSALGSGTLTINNNQSLWLKPTQSGNQVWTNPWFNAGASGGRLIVKMNSGTDMFSFQNGSNVATSGVGSRNDAFIMQDGILLLDSQAVAALAGKQMRVDYGSTVRVAPGSQNFKYINFSSNNSATGKTLNLSFDADFSNPGNPTLGHLLLDAYAITIAGGVQVRFDSSTPLGSISTPSTPSGSNLLVMDDDTSSNVFTGTLMSFSATSTRMSDVDLSRLILNQNIYVSGTISDELSVGGNFNQNGVDIGSLLYGYNLSKDAAGIYLNAGISGIDVWAGKTLTLSGDTSSVPGANEIRLRITGSGNLDVHATNSILISNPANTLSGMTTVTSGTLLLTGKLPGGVTINPNTTLQIGDGSAAGEVGGSIVHNGTLLWRRTLGDLSANVSGSGQLVFDNGFSMSLSGSNSHTGGVTFAGKASDISYYLYNGHALGSGQLNVVSGGGAISLWMRPKASGDVVLNNSIVMSNSTSRLIVFMPNMTDKFTFGNSAGTDYRGSFVGQQGTFELSGQTAAVLATAQDVRFDRGSTVYIDNSGTAVIRNLSFSQSPGTNDPGGKNPHATLVFDADFSGTGNPKILSNLLVTEKLNFAAPMRIKLNHTGAIPIPDFTVTTSGSNLLGLDDEVNKNSTFTKLISVAEEAVITGAANYLANITLLDAAGDRINAAHNFAITQNGDTIGKGYADYYAAEKSDGIYMTYGLAQVSVNSGKTLILAGDTANDNTFNAKLSGDGNVEVRATNAIKLGTYYGSNDLMGTLIVSSGTLICGTPGVFSSVGYLDLKPGAAIDMNDADQTIGYIHMPENTSLNLNHGQLTVAKSGTLNGTLLGTGAIITPERVSLDASGNNPDLDINWNTSGTLNLHSAGAAGKGQVTANGLVNMENISGGEFNATVTGTGVFTITSSTFATTKGVSVSTYNINESDITVRHIGGLYASSLTEVRNSTIRIDTSSHVGASTLRLHDSTIAFVPQRDGTYGNLLVNNLETPNSGTTTIKMNVDLTKAGAGDSVIVRDNILGSYVLDITNRAPGNNGDDAVALRIVRTPTAAGLANFTLKDGYIEAGIYTYELIQGDPANGAFILNDPNSYYLAVANARPLTRTAQAVLSTAAVAGAEWHYSLDSLNKRMGDLRREIDASSKDRFYNTWGRSSAYKLRADQNLVGAAFDEDVYNFTFGADVGRRIGSGSSALTFGVYGDIAYVDRTFDNRSTGSTNSYALGIYGTWLHSKGWYADAIFKGDTKDNKFTAIALDNSQARGAYTGKSFTWSIELGRKFDLGRNWWLEPGLQLAGANFDKSNYATDNGIEVVVGETSAIQYRAQARFGWNNVNGKLQPYGRLAYASCNGDSLNITANGKTLSSELDFDDTRYEVGLGISYLFNNKNQFYLEYEYSKADYYDRPWAVNLGFRHLW